jgi:hypothetical protein
MVASCRDERKATMRSKRKDMTQGSFSDSSVDRFRLSQVCKETKVTNPEKNKGTITARLETAHEPSPPHLSTELSQVVPTNTSGRGIGSSRGFLPFSGSKYRHCGLAQLADGIASHAIDYYITVLRKYETSVAFWCPSSSVPILVVSISTC